MAPRLPFDIIELIIEEAPQKAVFLLVSKDFYYPARKAIFRTIDIVLCRKGGWTPKRQVKDLAEILSSNPEISTVVSSVNIGFIFDRAPSPARKCPGINEPTFPVVLNLLRDAPIKTLSLGARPVRQNISDFPVSTLEAMIALRCSPSLRSLSISKLSGLPLLLLTGMGSQDRVEDLALESTRVHPDTISNPLYPFTRSTLPSFLNDPSKPEPENAPSSI